MVKGKCSVGDCECNYSGFASLGVRRRDPTGHTAELYGWWWRSEMIESLRSEEARDWCHAEEKSECCVS